jgi:hypothetical protein
MSITLTTLQIQCSQHLSNIDVGVLGAFTTLRKAAIIFVVSGSQSVRMGQLGSHWTDFYEI